MTALLGASYFVANFKRDSTLPYRHVIDAGITVCMALLVLWTFTLLFKAWCSRKSRMSKKQIAIGIATIFVVIVGSAVEAKDLGVRNQQIVTDAVAIAQASDLVRSRLGTDLQVGWPIGGSYSYTDTTGSAVLSVPIVGRRASGSLHIEGFKDAKGWELTLVHFLAVRGNRSSNEMFPLEIRRK